MKINQLLLILSIILLCYGCIKTKRTIINYSNPIIGKWQSDNNRMYEWLEEFRDFSDEKIKKWKSIETYFDSTLEISNNKYTQYFSGIVHEVPFDIIRIENSTMAIATKDNMSDQIIIQLISIEDENHFSIYHERNEIREFYKRIE